MIEFVVYGWSGGSRFDASALVEAASHVEAADLFMRDYPFNARFWKPHLLKIEHVDRSELKIFAVTSLDPLVIAGEMTATTHVLWEGRVLCEDLRLRGVPRDWPTGQRWISLADAADGNAAPSDRCATCWSRVPEFFDRLRPFRKE